ncbi:MAG TPA: sigma-54 dependent transcriptional regulator [Gemmatimonadaceae bacterium]|nr:sigma-54 dependent transcriptional regulator [Gemmatimonadaceae bacterium]
MAAPVHSYDDTDATLADFCSDDAAMQACLERARMAAKTDLPILILGESGTGKTILARAIHNSSARRARPFIAFNAAALSETLLDSQLFGHERGAFTGAQNRVKGKFELANSGTLFLDEVADLSPSAQSKILRAVESGEFERLGSETLQRADVRLISATNHPLSAAAGRNGFREDLFFRIAGITLTVPALRERPHDLPTLLVNEIARASQRHGTSIVGLDREAANRLLTYPWPGNLRELSKVVQAAVALTTNEVIGVDQLLLAGAAPGSAEAARPAPTSDRSLRHAVHRHISRVLDEVGGNKRRAARELGVSRATLERKLQEMAKASRR